MQNGNTARLTPSLLIPSDRRPDKCSWFIELVSTGEYTIRSLPGLYNFLDTRFDDYRDSTGTQIQSKTSKEDAQRKENFLYYNAIITSGLGVDSTCSLMGCVYSAHPNVSMISQPQLNRLEPADDVPFTPGRSMGLQLF